MKNGARTMLLLIGDVAVLVGAFFLMIFLSFSGQFERSVINLHLAPFSILGIMWLAIFFIFNLYDTEASRPTIPHLRRVVIAFITGIATGIVFFYALPFSQITPKTNLLIFGISCFLLFIGWRRIFYNIFASYFRKEVVFIVEDQKNIPQVNDLKNYIEKYPQSGFKNAGVYNGVGQFPKQDALGTQVFIVSKEIWRNNSSFEALYGKENRVLDLAYAYEDILGRIPVEAIDEGWFMHNIRSHGKKVYELEERVLGVIIALVTIIITSPILLVVALAIKLGDGGPVLYSQVRYGKNGKNFRLYKFRSMEVDAEKNGPEWSSKGDPRVTPVGKILRKLHVDELPQMINVVKGDLALVGPRPERPAFVEKLTKEIPFYHFRHIISPGFTGWAQIKFGYAGNVEDSKQKFEYDLYYIKNRNIFMDFGIILRTVQIIFTH